MAEFIQCPLCHASNYRGAAICAVCGAVIPPAHNLTAEGAGSATWPAGPRLVGQPTGAFASPVAQPLALRLPLHPGRPWASWALITINVAVWLAMTAAGGSTDGRVLLAFGAKYGPAILAGEYWRLFTTMFLHIGLTHLAVNGYALLVLGPQTERFLGLLRFLVVYLLAGLISSAVSYCFDPSLAAGASGAIFGLVGALGALFYRNRRVLGSLGRRRLGNLVTVVIINLVIGLVVPNIDNWAHLGGLAGGLAVGWALAPTYRLAVSVPEGLPRVIDGNSLRQRWWVVPAGMALVAGLTLGGSLRESRSAGGYQQKGEAHLQAGDWEEAIGDFSVALDQDPSLWSAYLFRAEAYLQSGDSRAALSDFDAVIRVQPPARYLSMAYAGRARIYMLEGREFEALTDLNSAVNLVPDAAYPYYVRGMAYYAIGQHGLGRQDLERALALGLDDQAAAAAAREALNSMR